MIRLNFGLIGRSDSSPVVINRPQKSPISIARPVNSISTFPTLRFDLALDTNCRAAKRPRLSLFAISLKNRCKTRCRPATVRLGTTRGTNALLTRSGARTALVTTRGFRDLLRIGNQDRPGLFDLDIKLPELLYELVVEVDERTATNGSILKTPNEAILREDLQELKTSGTESLAICFLNSYANPKNELEVARVAHEIGFHNVSVSHEVSPLIKLVSRGDTTCVDAYLNPVLKDYTQQINQQLHGREFRLMTSAGNLVACDSFSGKDSILSGPAGGVVGFAAAAQQCGFDRAIGFDMGGTSTDVARFDGSFDREYETKKAGVRVVTPMMAIHTVAAGGGSICSFDGVKLVVGPDSAGAEPGPACYGRGGPLTVTDVNLYLGKIAASHFPFPLDRDAVVERLVQLQSQIEATSDQPISLMEIADGFVRIANANMAQAINAITIAKGHDAREYLLVAFGGAGAQHACGVADLLQITRILIHPDAGILSAVGISQAQIARHGAIGIYQPLDSVKETLDERFRILARKVIDNVVAEGVSRKHVHCQSLVELRFAGTDSPLNVEYNEDLVDAFHSAHETRFGWTNRHRQIEVVAIRVEATGDSTNLPEDTSRLVERTLLISRDAETKMTFDGTTYDRAGVHYRSSLSPGIYIPGPLQILEDHATTIVDPKWNATVLSGGELLLERSSSPDGSTLPRADTTVDPIRLEIFNRHFEAIAEQMGITLQNTSSSTNVKERLDFSCAIFTAAGDLVVNAPHIPVHLGAMGETVRAILADHADIRPGDVFITNDPYRGGSHLPDVTVLTPVFADASTQLLFFTASRAHHAEIGGTTPGSMPPFSKTLAEEGVLIRSCKLIDQGNSRFDDLRKLLANTPFPSRDVETNIADVSAQVAANRQGAHDLRQLAEKHSWPVVAAYMEHIQNAAEQKTRKALSEFSDGNYEFADSLDCDATIRVRIQVSNDSATIDFAGTDPVQPTNLNANRAIVTAAVLYVLRTLIGESIPLNQGVLEPVDIRIPESMLDPPASDNSSECAAIVGGNVETSQRVVDVLLGALKLAAASQGTMNNLLFGDKTFGYYETICGGAGATANASGASAVHTHMTNTRITDPEVLEQRYPVRVHQFSIRLGSGGSGNHAGGDGVIRELEFLAPLTVSLLTQRREPNAPYGMSGGAPGSPGQNQLVRATGESIDLPASAQIEVGTGDRLTIRTPGGGGFGLGQT